MSKITYANKVALNENVSIPVENKVTDDDMNEIKVAINENDGWIPFPTTLAYSSVDSPTGVMTTGADVRSLVEQGMKIKYDQAQSLTGYWSFNTNSTPEVGGFTMANVGTPTYSAGKFSNALTLNGTDQALSITDTAVLKPTGAFTLGAWFKISATGANRMIFQSKSYSGSNWGVGMYVDTNNKLVGVVGNGTISGSCTSVAVVTDNVFHYAVLTYNNNYIQLYIDGLLVSSSYSPTPTYQATNYVRIGCGNDSGANQFFWSGQIDDLFLINGYALSEEYVRTKYIATTAQGASALTVTKTAFISADPTATTITVYHGTDSMLINDTISNIYYSKVKKPLGFNINKDKWSVIVNDTTERSQITSGTTIYNLGSITITIPIGLWDIKYKGLFQIGVSSATAGGKFMTVSLSNANNTINSDNAISVAGADIKLVRTYVEKTIDNLSSKTKTAYYLNVRDDAGGNNYVYYLNSSTGGLTMIIKAVSNYL